MILALLLAAAAPAPAAETPRGFMARVYAGYRSSSFNPLAHPDRYFTPALVAAIREDARLAHGEVGYLDGDPVCQCQDSGGMHAKVGAVTSQGRDKAKVAVSIGWDHDPARPATFSLERTKAGWRIADVSSTDEPSLAAALAKSNREARARQ